MPNELCVLPDKGVHPAECMFPVLICEISLKGIVEKSSPGLEGGGVQVRGVGCNERRPLNPFCHRVARSSMQPPARAQCGGAQGRKESARRQLESLGKIEREKPRADVRVGQREDECDDTRPKNKPR